MDDSVTQQADVLIVGGGLVGLSLAAALGTAGVATIVIDRQDPAAMLDQGFDGRVAALAWANWRMLESIGVWPLLSEAEPILDIRVSDGPSTLFLHYDHRTLGSDPFGFMVENRLNRQALYRRLEGLNSVRLLAPAGLSELRCGAHDVAARLDDGRRLKARLAVAADGPNSVLRRAAGIRNHGWSYDQTGIVCTVAHERPHLGVAQERFLPAGPFAILPMTGNRSSLVWTERSSLAPALLAAPEAAFLEELAGRFGDHLGSLAVVGPRFGFPLALGLAERYVDRRLALIGDAAHRIHPIAGQGLNLGLRDVAALAEIVVDRLRLGLDPGDAVALARYQRWRRFDSLLMAAVTDSLNRLFSNDIAPVRLVRDLGLAAVNKIDPLKRLFMQHARGSAGDLPRLLAGEPL